MPIADGTKAPTARDETHRDSIAGRDGPGAPRSLHLVGSGQPPCGVGDFSRLLLAALKELEPGAHHALVVEPGTPKLGRLWRTVGDVDAVVANFPVVAWKRALGAPLAAFTLATLRGRTRIAILHEWASLHRLRRLVLRPILALSNRIIVLSPQIRSELAADPLVGSLARRGVLMPLPPNLARPVTIAQSPLRERILAARREGRLVLGHFGSIYPGKQPEAVLEIAAALKARGENPLLVFIGSFIKATDRIEARFEDKVAALGLTDTVVVTGYVASPEELFGLFETADAFAYVLPEGLTSRRASVLACLQSGRPVVVTAPAHDGEFDHHPRFRALLETGAIMTVPRGGGPEAYADLVLAARLRPAMPTVIDRSAWFADAARVLVGTMRTCRGNRDRA